MSYKRKEEIGNATMYLGDCLEVLPKIPDREIVLVLTDPPYGTTACKWDVIIPFEPMWESLWEVAKPDAAVVLFGTQPFTSILIASNIAEYRYDWYWEKDKAANWMFGNKMPLKTFEIASVFYRNQPKYNPQKTTNPNGPSKRHLYKNPNKITKNVRDVMGDGWKESEMDDTQNYHGKNYEPDKLLPRQNIYFPREQKGKLHPTQKPVALMEYLIRTYTDEGDTILDFAMGSGTTGVACAHSGRKFVGIEIEEKYFDIACQRVRQAYSEGTQMKTVTPPLF